MRTGDLLTALLRCPICEGRIGAAGNEVLCESCGHGWPVRNGIPDFRKTPAYFYDFEYSEDGMQALLKDAREQGWLQALKKSKNKFGRTPSEYFILYNSSPDRAPWVEMLGGGPDSSVLDFGCGMGAVSMVLAERFGRVVSFDASLERAEFLSIRKEQQNKPTVLVVAWDGVGLPPFQKESFDAAVLNGVLEWTPEAIRSGDPMDVQVTVLERAMELLKPGGRVYVAIENRFGMRYFFGDPDHHSNLRFVTLMPRMLADGYSWILKRKSYRVYTHSLRSYYRMFSRAGFSRVDAYEAYPRYMFPEEMIPLADEKGLHDIRAGKPGWENRFIRMLSRIGLARYFVFCFGFVAFKENSPNSC
jgi:SAM-dependent methyltransferase